MTNWDEKEPSVWVVWAVAAFWLLLFWMGIWMLFAFLE